MPSFKSIGIALLTIFAPIQAAVAVAFTLIIVDFFTGIWAAKKRKEKITSAGIRRTLSKLFVFESALLLAHLAQTYLTGEILPVVKLVSTLIAVVELKSIYENLDVIGGGDFLRSVIGKLGSINDGNDTKGIVQKSDKKD